MKYKAIVFDLDGTLIDSLTDIAICANKTLEELGFQTHEIEKYKHFVGDGAKVLMENALPNDIKDEKINEALNVFTRIYERNIHNNTFAYDGIYNMLDHLENIGIKKSILTNKHHEFALKYVQKLFSDYNFIDVFGQIQDIPKKPDPYLALKIINNSNVKPHETIFVGDTSTDIMTAKNAGFDSIGVLWGFRDENELRTHGATYIVNHPKDIIDIINS